MEWERKTQPSLSHRRIQQPPSPEDVIGEDLRHSSRSGTLVTLEVEIVYGSISYLILNKVKPVCNEEDLSGASWLIYVSSVKQRESLV